MHVLERQDFLKVLEQERSPPRRGERHDFSSAPSIGTFDVPTFIWSSPSLIIEKIAEEFSDLLGHARVTLTQTPVAFFFALVLGLGFGLLLHFSALAKRALLSG